VPLACRVFANSRDVEVFIDGAKKQNDLPRGAGV
jgi:hypothetical protein